MDHLVIIDGHHLMYRAYYAIPRGMHTKAGEQTNAIFGVASMLLTLLKVEEPHRLVFCFDAGEETFRHEENATYKEGRAETPDEFYVQIPRILQVIEAFGFRHVSATKYEADDFLCTYATAAEAAGMRVTIVTGDRDAFQLATEKTRIAIPHKGYQGVEYLGPEQILAKYGVRPDQIVSYKGLTGDASDNLPGVRGIGPKGAAKLLQQYGTLMGIYEHLAEIPEGVRAKLEHDRDQAFFCERMAQLIGDIPLPVSLEDLQIRSVACGPVLELFRELEFTVLDRRLRSLVESPYGKARFHLDSPGAVTPVTKQKSQLSLF